MPDQPMTAHPRQASIEALHKEIRTMAKSFEAMRLRHIHAFTWGTVIIVIAVTIGALTQGMAKNNIDTAIFVAVTALVPSGLLYHALNLRYRKKAKTLFIQGLKKATGFNYKASGAFSVRDADPHKILPLHNKQRSEDGFEGYYKDTYIALQEIHLSDLKQDPEHKNREREYTLFWGLLIKIGVRKPLSGHTVVVPHNAMQTFFRNRFSAFSPVNPSNKKFARIYDAVTTDQVEARAIMTTSFMDKFLESSEMTGAYWSEVSFNGSEIMVALQRFKPLFEINPMWRPVTPDILRRSAGELEAALHLVDVMKLNPQIGV